MGKTFVYSDPHFGHANIIKYESRPFQNVHDMDYQLIKRWNQEVSKDDTVFVLGDVSFYNKEETAHIINQLNGRKFLILGNHDRGRSVKWWKEVGFDEVSKYPIIYGGFFIMSHEPVYLNEHMLYVNIHGHTHSQSYESKQYVNVSVEKIDYRPVLLDSIISRYKNEND